MKGTKHDFIDLWWNFICSKQDLKLQTKAPFPNAGPCALTLTQLVLFTLASLQDPFVTSVSWIYLENKRVMRAWKTLMLPPSMNSIPPSLKSPPRHILCIWLHVEQLKQEKTTSILDQKYFSRCHFPVTNRAAEFASRGGRFGTMLIINSHPLLMVKNIDDFSKGYWNILYPPKESLTECIKCPPSWAHAMAEGNLWHEPEFESEKDTLIRKKEMKPVKRENEDLRGRFPLKYFMCFFPNSSNSLLPEWISWSHLPLLGISGTFYLAVPQKGMRL